MKIMHPASFALTLGIAVALSACGKKEEAPAPVVAPAPPPAVVAPAPPPAPEGISFVSLTLGNAVGADQVVSVPASTFAPTDTIYAAVATKGAAPSAAIVARWTFGDGQLVDESSQSIAPTGPATTTFHISKPDGWPLGNYKVDVTIDGNPVASQGFDVK
ncbi:MAG TPA: hypothetical protein PLR28_04505 [Dokdonella sp.]|uniref:hypothetical protein n=1 Tax=Dokdonella sp. TaxID=2291710 RepID=UPI002B705EE8|nr:hypothetical protein [Dokdonella sp.]HOX71689.1 hypothetical protein [Dokdonella sp.]HPG93799.1 hypothetical protein [Dokdonella sp.]HPN80222.1 hypothetical protein [Dokdonella sp.]